MVALHFPHVWVPPKRKLLFPWTIRANGKWGIKSTGKWSASGSGCGECCQYRLIDCRGVQADIITDDASANLTAVTETTMSQLVGKVIKLSAGGDTSACWLVETTTGTPSAITVASSHVGCAACLGIDCGDPCNGCCFSDQSEVDYAVTATRTSGVDCAALWSISGTATADGRIGSAFVWSDGTPAGGGITVGYFCAGANVGLWQANVWPGGCPLNDPPRVSGDCLGGLGTDTASAFGQDADFSIEVTVDLANNDCCREGQDCVFGSMQADGTCA